MSEKTKMGVGAASAKDKFPDGFDQALYWVSADQNAFDIATFRHRLPKKVRNSDDAIVLISPRDAKRSRYHVFFSWSITDTTVKFNIGYNVGAVKHDDSEVQVDSDEPFAEDFMSWFGQFFRLSSVKFHIHTRFKYSLKTRSSTFPMRLTTTSLPGGAELYGVALRLPTALHGASSVRITQGRKRWFADVVSDRRLRFGTFSPYADADASVAVLGIFLGEDNS